jgi:hypothetical protein
LRPNWVASLNPYLTGKPWQGIVNSAESWVRAEFRVGPKVQETLVVGANCILFNKE